MGISPAKAHFMQAAAAAQQSPGSPEPHDHVSANAYELMLMKLAEDKRRLKGVQSLEHKARVKAEILPEYQPWIEGTLQAATGQQDEVLMTVLVWSIDAGQLDTARRIGRYAIENKLVMPDQYERGVATVLAEEFAEQSLKAIAAEQPVDLEALLDIDSITAESDMPDQVRAKLNKSIGYAQRAAGNLEEAKARLTRAFSLHDKVGVKKDLERLEVAIKNSAGNVPATPPAVAS